MTENKIVKLLICDSYSRNTGDVGILISLLEQVKKTYSDLEINVEASHPIHLKHFYNDSFNGIKIFPRIIDIQKVDGEKANHFAMMKEYFLAFYDAVTFFIWAFFVFCGGNYIFFIRKSKREQAVMLQNVDLVISTGGGFISTFYKYELRLYLHIIVLFLRKPIFICAQSIGPFETKVARFLIPFLIKKYNLISVREPWSYNYLLKYRVKSYLTADLAFLLPQKKSNLQVNMKSVSICIKNNNKITRDAAYIKTIIAISTYLIDLKYFVFITSQTPNDDEMALSIVSQLQQHCSRAIKYGVNPQELKNLYASNDFVIASRMHAIIFACEAGVPFVALSYEPKFVGLFECLMYDKELILHEGGIDPEKLIKAADRIISNRDLIVQQLNEVMPLIRLKAASNVNLIKEYND